MPPSVLGARRDSAGSIGGASSPPRTGRQDGPFPSSGAGTAADASTAEPADHAIGSSGGIAPHGGIGQPRVPAAGQMRAGLGQQDLAAEGTPTYTAQNSGPDGWRAQDAARKNAAASAAAMFEKENAQPNGLVSAAAFLRAEPGPGELPGRDTFILSSFWRLLAR